MSPEDLDELMGGTEAKVWPTANIINKGLLYQKLMIRCHGLLGLYICRFVVVMLVMIV